MVVLSFSRDSNKVIPTTVLTQSPPPLLGHPTREKTTQCAFRLFSALQSPLFRSPALALSAFPGCLSGRTKREIMETGESVPVAFTTYPAPSNFLLEARLETLFARTSIASQNSSLFASLRPRPIFGRDSLGVLARRVF